MNTKEPVIDYKTLYDKFPKILSSLQDEIDAHMMFSKISNSSSFMFPEMRWGQRGTTVYLGSPDRLYITDYWSKEQI